MSVTYDSAMNTLSSMFSQVDREVISMVLHQNGGHMERTVEALLAMTGDKNVSPQPPPSSQRQQQPRSQPRQQAPPSHQQYPGAPHTFPNNGFAADYYHPGPYPYPPPPPTGAVYGVPVPAPYGQVPGLPAGFYAPAPPPQPYPQQYPAQAVSPPPSRNVAHPASLIPADFLRPPSYFRGIVGVRDQPAVPSSSVSNPQVDADAQIAAMLQDQEFMSDLAENPDFYIQAANNNNNNRNNNSQPAGYQPPAPRIPGESSPAAPSVKPATAASFASASPSSISSASLSSSSSSQQKQSGFSSKWDSLTASAKEKLASIAAKFKRDKKTSPPGADDESGAVYQSLPSLDDDNHDRISARTTSLSSANFSNNQANNENMDRRRLTVDYADAVHEEEDQSDFYLDEDGEEERVVSKATKKITAALGNEVQLQEMRRPLAREAEVSNKRLESLPDL